MKPLKVYRSHWTQAQINLGVIGEHQADIEYVYHERKPSNDPFQVPEPAWIEVTGVSLMLDGKEVDIYHWLSQSFIEELEAEILERW